MSCMSPMTSEPLLTVGGITAIASALIGALVAFGVPLTGDQTEAMLALIGTVAPLIVAVVGRRHVTPAPPDTRRQ